MTASFRRIYVVYPRGLRTGGPEALHQLVDTLRSLGHDAFLLPTHATRDTERAGAYSHYDAPEATNVEDTEDSAFVVPETLLYEAKRFLRAQPFIWWLSIDNSPIFNGARRLEHRRKNLSQEPYRSIAAEMLRGALRRQKFRRLLQRAQHLAQSQYAHGYLVERLGCNSMLLSDYTPAELPGQRSMRTGLGGNPGALPVVAYNPAKGMEVLEPVMRIFPLKVEWVALQGMTPEQVQRTLERAHVYLDLGHHPGKDRLPREAARAGAVVIVAKRGAGATERDIRIPERLRISADRKIVTNTTEVLQEVLDDVDAWRSRLRSYVATIGSERQTFEDEVRLIFVDRCGW